MGITIKDIAKKANVSTTTVSRVINNKPDVSDSTKEKIKKLIKENNYKPNDIARGLVLKKTKTIGLIVPDISNPFFPEIIKGVEHKTKDAGYSLIICDTDNQIKQEKSSIDLLLSKQVDGIIMSLSNDNLMDLTPLKESNVPIVQLDRSIPELKYPTSNQNITTKSPIFKYDFSSVNQAYLRIEVKNIDDKWERLDRIILNNNKEYKIKDNILEFGNKYRWTIQTVISAGIIPWKEAKAPYKYFQIQKN